MGRQYSNTSSRQIWQPNPALDLPMYRQIEAYIRQKSQQVSGRPGLVCRLSEHWHHPWG